MTWRPNSESSKLLFSAQRLLNSYEHSISLKQLFYLLVGLGEIEMSEPSYRKLCTLMLNSRKYGRINPDLFVDLEEFKLQAPDDSFQSFINSYRINRMSYQKEYVEVWVDKVSFSSFMKKIVAPYDIEVFTSEGFSPYAFTYSAYLRIMNAVKLGKIPRILYFSDFEPTSLLIFESVLSEIASLLAMTTREVSTFVFRVMLLPEHIVHYRLPYEVVDPSPKTRLFEERYSDVLRSTGLPSIIRSDIESLDPFEARRLILNSVFAIIDHGKMSEVSDIEKERKLALEQLFKDKQVIL